MVARERFVLDPYRGGLVRRFGLPELLGIAVSLVCLVWWSPNNDYLAGPKLLVLITGALAVVPAGIYRWRTGRAPTRLGLVLVGVAVALPLWSIISWLGSGAPFAGSLFGWWGRSNGILSLIGAAALLFAASSLTRDEFGRVVTWLLAGGALISLIGLAQLAGNQVVGGSPDPQVIATLGNINFSAAYFAIILVLAVGRALDAAQSTSTRSVAGVLVLVTAALLFVNGSEQGPAAAAGGLLALAVLWALSYRGPRRELALASVGGVVLFAAGATLASFAGVGPLAGLWESANFRVRQGTWLTGWDILQSLPAFGTGPDGLQRYANEYAPEFYAQLVGARSQLSAAHNVPLQYGATLGWLGLILWIALMVGVGIALVVCAARSQRALTFTIASVGGAFVAYVVQAQVSIDMGALLALGWLLAGMGIAAACGQPPQKLETEPVASRPAKGAPVSSKRRGASVSRTPVRPNKDGLGVPVWVPVTGVLFGVAGACMGAVPVVIDSRTSGEVPADQLLSIAESPWAPCSYRVPLIEAVLPQLPADISIPAIFRSAELDQRCDTIAHIEADFALQEGDAERANRATLASITYNPRHSASWILRARYHLLTGDIAAAERDYITAADLMATFPDNAVNQDLLTILRADLDALQAN
jgi:O-antigen ligase